MARVHFERALKLSDGLSIAAYINFVTAVSVAAQNEQEFDEFLDIALRIKPDAIPDAKVLRILQHERVKFLIANKDMFILPAADETADEEDDNETTIENFEEGVE
jgi:hypothetical protein